MGVTNSEVGYTSAMPRREDHEVRNGHVGHWIKKNYNNSRDCVIGIVSGLRTGRPRTRSILGRSKRAVSHYNPYIMTRLMSGAVPQLSRMPAWSEKSQLYVF